MNVTENADEIIIRHTPLVRWISGALLAFLIGGILFWHIVFNASTSIGAFPILLLAAAGITMLYLETNPFRLLLAPQTTVTVSLKTKSVNILSRRIYGAKTERYFFHQIRKFKSHKGEFIFAPAYSLALVLTNGKSLKLRIPIAADKKEAGKFIKKLNQFTQQQPP
jgi:hypothetical protein